MIRQAKFEPQLILEEINDPAEVARRRQQDERIERNNDWLQAHWPELLPQARGRFIAIAGQEAFLETFLGKHGRRRTLLTRKMTASLVNMSFRREDRGFMLIVGKWRVCRDVLNLFDVIVSFRRDQVLLLAPNHEYRITK